jgi:hypothetical protein
MAASAPRSKAKRTFKATDQLPEGHTESEAVSHAITSAYRDLEPSVRRIMVADLGEAGRLHAITLFQGSLGVPGDPNRDPAVAIEAGRAWAAQVPSA